MGISWNDDREGPRTREIEALIDRGKWSAVPDWELYVVLSHALEGLSAEIMPYREAHRIVFRLMGQINPKLMDMYRDAYPPDYFPERT